MSVDLSDRSRAANRAAFLGKPEASWPCTWRDNEGVLAIVERYAYLVLASESFPTRTEYTQLAKCQCIRENATLTLRIQSKTERVTLPTNAAAAAAEASIDATLRRSRACTPKVIGRHEQFVSCTYLGGSQLPLEPGARYDMLFREDQLEVYPSPARSAQEPRCVAPMDAILALHLQGPGLLTSGGGAIGGGIGLEGAAIGMAVAGVFNALTTRSRVESIIVLQTAESEGFFLHQGMTPSELRRYLSPVFVRLRRAQPSRLPAPVIPINPLSSTVLGSTNSRNWRC